MKRFQYRKLNAAECLVCKTTLVSYDVHDYRTCRCGNLMVDGGFDYVRRGAKDFNKTRELDWYEKVPMKKDEKA